MSLGTCAEKVAGATNGFKPDMMFSRFGQRAFKKVSEQGRGRRAPDKTRGRGRPRPTLELNAGVEAAPLTSLHVRCSLSAAQVQAYESKLTRMNTTLSFAIAAAGLLLSLTSGSGQTPAKPTNSVSLGQSHFVAFGTNKIHYVTAGKGNHTIVFVHCWAGNSGFWREQVPALNEKARLVLI